MAKIDPVMSDPETIAKLGGRVGAFGAAIVLMALVVSANTVISPGYTGVIFNIWTGAMRTVPQGLAFRIPWVTRVQSYPTALRTYTMVQRQAEGSSFGDDSIDLPTREGQHIRQDISVTYNTSESRAAQVFRSFKGSNVEEIEGTFIRRTIITAAQNAAGQMSLSEIISARRGDLQTAIEKTLGGELDKMGFILDKVNLGASHLPAALEGQLQTKMAAQQQAQQAEYELQKQEILAKAEVAKAQGLAQSVVVRAKAEAEANRLLQMSLNPTLINYRAVDRWDGHLPQVTGSAMPFIDLKKP